MSVLDDAVTYARLDPGGMRDLIAGLPEQVRDAYAAAAGAGSWLGGETPDQVVILGMGGSAIGGEILASLAAMESPAPVRVVRGYDAPPGLDERALVVACSYSGETEETLSAFRQVLPTTTRKLVMTTGGTLAKLAQGAGVPAFVFAFDSQPRAAIGYALAPLLRVAAAVGFIADPRGDIEEAIAAMGELRARVAVDVPEDRNPAKQTARRLVGRLPAIFGAQHLAPVATRWRGQVNENAKSWAASYELPEADHNAIVGFGLPRSVVGAVHAVFLRAESLHARVRLRYELTQAEIAAAGATAERFDCPGTTPLAQVLNGVLYGDYVSLYLAMLNGVDPTPVEPIARLKAQLARER